MTSRSGEGRLAKLARSARGLPRRLAHVGRVALDILYWTVTFQVVSRLRQRRYARLIRRSGLFNARFYLSQCGEDPEAREDPLAHYLVRGAARGLEPNPLFDTPAYLAQNPAAAGPRKNPLVHFIRAGGGAARAAVLDVASAPAIAPISPGEALLRGHPFRAPDPAGSGRGPSSILVVDRCTPARHGDSGSARMFAIVKLLHDLGCAVTLVTEGTEAAGDLEDDLGRLGIDVHRGFSTALGHLAVEGHRYRWALLSGTEAAFRYLPAVRAYCPQAKAIYDAVRIRRIRPHDATRRSESSEEAERLDRVQRVNAACSDVVLAATAEEREALVSGGCGAHIEVISDLRSGREVERAKARVESLLFGASAPEARDETPVQEGSGAWTA